MPQFNWGDLIGTVARTAVPVILSLLQSNPQLLQQVQGQQPAMGPQGTGPQWPQYGAGGMPQMPSGGMGYTLSPFGGQPQIGPFGQPGLAPQSFLGDIGGFLSQAAQQVTNVLAQHVAQQLPTLISGALQSLAASPQLRQQAAGAGLAPQSIFGDIGGFLSQAAQQVGQYAAQQLAQQIPNIVQGVLQSLAAQPRLGQGAPGSVTLH